MTTHHDEQLSGEFSPTDPTQLSEAFAAAFNSGDAARLERLYEDGGILVPVPGHPVTGAERAGATEHLLRFGLPMDVRLRHCYVAGDLALLIIDWSLRGTARDGTDVDMAGTATDVARRGPDGIWRTVIDNPAGSA